MTQFFFLAKFFSSCRFKGMWKEVLNTPSLELESAIAGFFPGDAEYSKTVVDTMESVLSSGDVHRWAELKRLDAHAAKHQRIAADYILNTTSLLINRVCLLGGEKYCKQFRDIVYDRIENFHNQCRDGDSVPQSISRVRAKHEMLHSYNVKSYASILSLVGTLLTRSDEATAAELGKRIVSNHNHWFNFGHLLDFLKSIVSSQERDLLVALGPSICLTVSGICGIRLGTSPKCGALIDLTPGVSVSVWTILLEMLEVGARTVPATARPVVASAALNALASLNFSLSVGLARTIINRVVSLLPQLGGCEEEILNFLLCASRYVDTKERQHIEYEFACRYLITQIGSSSRSKSERCRVLLLKWLRFMCCSVSTCAGSVLCFKALLGLDSNLFGFVIDCLVGSASPESIHAGIELIRLLLQRDSVSVANILLTPRQVVSISIPVAPLAVVLMNAFNLRRTRKACSYILHQCVIRNPGGTRQVLFGTDYRDAENNFLRPQAVTQNIARALLDSEWETEMDLVASSILRDFSLVDFEALNQTESVGNLGNWSNATLVSLNSVLEAEWMFGLESDYECADDPKQIANRLEYWLVSESNILALTPEIQSVYHCVSARLMTLLAIFEASGSLAAELLGLVETSVGVLNNDLEKEIVAIDALFLLVNNLPEETSTAEIADLEFLFGVKIVAQLSDESVNRQAMLRFIQYRWPNRYAILRSLLSGEDWYAAKVEIIVQLLKVVGIELLVASQVIDSDAEHVRNMRDFGESFLVSEVNRGRSSLMEYVFKAFTALEIKSLIPQDETFFVPDLTDPRRSDKTVAVGLNEEIMNHTVLASLSEAVVSMVVHWSLLTNEVERSEVVSFLIESIETEGNEFWKQNIYSKIVPKLYSILQGGSSNLLAFNLRTLKKFVSQLELSKNIVTRTGIVESICLSLTPFVASAEIWMIERDHELARQVVDGLMGYSFEVIESNGRVRMEAIALPLTVLRAVLATRQSFAIVEIVKDMSIDRFRSQIEKTLASTDDKMASAKELVAAVIDIVEKEVLFKELAI